MACLTSVFVVWVERNADLRIMVWMTPRQAEAQTIRQSMGHPFDEASLMGPMVTPAQCERAKRLVTRAVEQGATMLCGHDYMDMSEDPKLQLLYENAGLQPSLRCSGQARHVSWAIACSYTAVWGLRWIQRPAYRQLDATCHTGGRRFLLGAVAYRGFWPRDQRKWLQQLSAV